MVILDWPSLYGDKVGTTDKKGAFMGLFKSLDIPQKEPGEGLNTADRSYLIKLIVVASVLTASLSIFGTMLLLEYTVHRMDRSAKALKEWAKKADLANEMLNEMFKVEQIKESYKLQGIGATEDKINFKKEVENETKD